MFGMMGAGKSTFSNTLINSSNHFQEGYDPSSVSRSILVASLNMPHGIKFNVFDVPGLGDPELKKLDYIKEFLSDLTS